MRFGSACSGIEAASVAWHPLGWRAAWLAEIEKFASAVLAHHYPDVPNLGDMRNLVRMILRGEVEATDVFTGGTPCQAFSVAGKRESLSDDRGNLSLTFCEIADAIDHVRAARGDDACVVVWENVPGVLSTRDNAFGCFLGALAGAGCELQPAGGRWSDAGCVYGPNRTVAWRVLDAQYFGLAQRRRRVFVVASARDGFDPAAVLFERDGVRRDSAPRREAGQGAAVCPTLRAGGNSTGGDRPPGTDVDTADSLQVVASVALRGRDGGATAEIGDDCAFALRASVGGGDKPHAMAAVAFAENSRSELRLEGSDGQTVGTLSTGGGKPGQGTPCIAFMADDYKDGSYEEAVTARPLTTSADRTRAAPIATQAMAVRRLTPRECERLQGFPDDYTRIPWRGKPADACPDGPRYKALGNSWAVPCARWIGERIARALA